MAVAMSATAGVASAQPTMAPVNEAPNPFTTIENHFKLPEGRTWGSNRNGVWVSQGCRGEFAMGGGYGGGRRGGGGYGGGGGGYGGGYGGGGGGRGDRY